MNLNATLLGQMITFGVFVWFTTKFIWPPLIKALRERQKKIADGLEAASRAEHTLALAQQRSSELLRESKKGAASLLSRAQSKSMQLLEETRNKSHQEELHLLQQAKAEIEDEWRESKELLAQTIIDRAIDSASKIMSKTMDIKTHKKLVDDLIDEIET